MPREIAQDKLDILLISETKVDLSFHSSQFAIDGFSSPFRLDRNSSGGGIMVFVWEEIPSKLLSEYKPNSSVENIFIEINLRSKKWLLSCSYNPNLAFLNNHIQIISAGIHFYSSKYDKFIVLWDFNAETSNPTISEFCATYNLKNLIKEPTYFKSLKNPTCIDLILTNRPKCFQNSNVFETGLSDFHKLTVTVLKAFFQKQKPKVIIYRNYKKFYNKNDLLNELLSKNVQHLDSFKATAQYIFDRHAPLREKHIRCNQAAFVNKNLRKEGYHHMFKIIE